ncbi:putative DNA-binding protein [Vibrio orientalis CIP 102891 = ATCC 33934]|uniref:DNA-binding protein n=1 Tax=Vibrio orientalis CIP 102891 = ATCC 33934 TaxID=675816 RepID=C9QC87_VIBOR|nr:YbaK/EbsC family protein [Vibrio orientalis]EEX95283.1 putative DNA-binding protein [Vibrio orientalis CIP 102891 = ATCC 33934]EGU52322.1 putative DNA-binding protein [Vibrio orientalis CIP 102891 = ATCC 33934]
MDKLETIYQFNKGLLQRLSIDYQEWQHEPILDFITDEKVAKQLGWTGTHSKSLFLKLKGAGYALLLTDKDSRLDAKSIKAITGKRPSIVDDNEMTKAIGCMPGAVCPFGLPSHIPIIVDRGLLSVKELLYTPGKPDVTIGLPSSRLMDILHALENPIIEM